MPYVVTTFGGRLPGGLAPPSRIFLKRDASMRCNAVDTSDTSVASDRSTTSTSKPASTVNAVPVCSARVTTDRPPT